MTLNIKNGLVQINETSEDKIINFHLKRGFAMLTAFRSEYTLAQNRSRNRQLASNLKSLGYGFIKVTGGYTENIGPDNLNWDDAEPTQDPNIRRLPIMEESFLVPMYDINAHDVVTDFNTFKSDMVDLGKKFEQDSVLVSPPVGQGSPAYIITNSRSGEVGSVDCTFNNLSVASVSDTYFSMKEKTLNKARAKRRDGVGGVKFESSWLDEPAHTISGVRIRTERNELPPFGSHYYGNSQVGNLTTLERRIEKLEQLVSRKNKNEDIKRLPNNAWANHVCDVLSGWADTSWSDPEPAIQKLKQAGILRDAVNRWYPTIDDVAEAIVDCWDDSIGAVGAGAAQFFIGNVGGMTKCSLTLYPRTGGTSRARNIVLKFNWPKPDDVLDEI